MVKGLEEMSDAKIAFTLHDGLPAVVNDPVSFLVAQKAAEEIVGSEQVVSQGAPSLGGEDFSFYQQRIPGTMIRFGAAKKEKTGPSHSGTFDFDEHVLSYGAQWLATVAVHGLQCLQQKQSLSVQNA